MFSREKFASRLLVLRKQAGLSVAALGDALGISGASVTQLEKCQQQLAERANVAEITIQNYESGRSNPVPTRLLAIADVLGVSLDTLVGRDENAFSPPDFDPLVEQVKSLSAPQRADVMKYIEFIKSRS